MVLLSMCSAQVGSLQPCPAAQSCVRGEVATLPRVSGDPAVGEDSQGRAGPDI